METFIQTKETIELTNLSQSSNSVQFLLPRQGWQNQQALIKAIAKAKRALDIAEISNFLD
jgi:hypothetical protein